jgi:hypothetical protein
MPYARISPCRGSFRSSSMCSIYLVLVTILAEPSVKYCCYSSLLIRDGDETQS